MAMKKRFVSKASFGASFGASFVPSLVPSLKSSISCALLCLATLFLSLLGHSSAARAAVNDSIRCPKYKVYYIDPATQFFTPPVPIEDHAEFVFCSDHPNLDEVLLRIKKLKPVRSTADLDSARIKVVPRGHKADALTFCSTGEITFRGKQYRLDRRLFEPSLVSIQEEGDKRRATASEQERDQEDEVRRRNRSTPPSSPREPAKAKDPKSH